MQTSHIRMHVHDACVNRRLNTSLILIYTILVDIYSIYLNKKRRKKNKIKIKTPNSTHALYTHEQAHWPQLKWFWLKALSNLTQMVYGCYEPNKAREGAECVYINQRHKSTFLLAHSYFHPVSATIYHTYYNASGVLYEPAISAIPPHLTFNRVGSFFTAKWISSCLFRPVIESCCRFC